MSHLDVDFDLHLCLSDLMAALSQTMNNTEETLDLVAEQDSGIKTQLDSVTSDAQKLERTVQELLDQVEFIKNSNIRGKDLQLKVCRELLNTIFSKLKH